MLDYAVIGSGIGGSGAALALRGFNTALFEKDANLGGCSGSFTKKGCRFNAAATTFACYNRGQVVYDFLHKHGVQIHSRPLKSALCVIQNNQSIQRYNDLDAFVDSINTVHYHPKNKAFYTLIKQINDIFYAQSGYYYSAASGLAKFRSLFSFMPLAKHFYPYLFESAYRFINRYFGGIDAAYLDFIDNQLLIAAQATSKEVNFLAAALALGYQFQDNHYVYGGLGSVFEAMAQKIPRVHTKTPVSKIQKDKDGFTLHTGKKTLRAKNVVLNTTVFDSAKLFKDQQIKNYLRRFRGLDSGVSAFVMYLKLKKNRGYQSHYQIIDEQKLPYTVSNSVFVSFGDEKDKTMAKSVTISIHVKTAQWQRGYEHKEEKLKEAILGLLARRLGLGSSDIDTVFCAKPHTFYRFLGRTTLGGIPVTKDMPVFRLPGNDTPFKGLYMTGDTTYAAQGWPGVLMGVNNLERLLCTR